MKLRSHEILDTPKSNKARLVNPSKFKQLFQRKTASKKKATTTTTTNNTETPHGIGLIHHLPHYVRKSIFRFLLEVKSGTPPSTPHVARPPPVMGIQALKTKKQRPTQSGKRSLRIKPTLINDHHHQQQQQEENEIQIQQQQNINNNYDMTILHTNFDDEDDDEDEGDAIFATKTSTNQKKQIPQWARKHELQIAICNQIYFHRNPSEIFGNPIDCSPTHLRTILHSMLPNVDLFDDNLHSCVINSNKSILV